MPVGPGAVGYEVGANELLHRTEVCTCEEVLKPALYDLLVFAGWDGDLILRAGVSVSIPHCGAMPVALQCTSVPYSPECVE